MEDMAAPSPDIQAIHWLSPSRSAAAHALLLSLPLLLAYGN